jgi:hypothetical protein
MNNRRVIIDLVEGPVSCYHYHSNELRSIMRVGVSRGENHSKHDDDVIRNKAS